MLSIDCDVDAAPDPSFDLIISDHDAYNGPGSDSCLRLAMNLPIGIFPRVKTPVNTYRGHCSEDGSVPLLELRGRPSNSPDIDGPTHLSLEKAAAVHTPLEFFALPSFRPAGRAHASQRTTTVAMPSFAPGPYALSPADLACPCPQPPDSTRLPYLRLAPMAPSALDPAGPAIGPVEPVMLPPIHVASPRTRFLQLRIQQPEPLVPLKREFGDCDEEEDVDRRHCGSDGESRAFTPRAKRQRCNMAASEPLSNVEGLRAGAELESTMTLEELAPYFAIPSAEAADRLGISTTRLKRITRTLGVARWPFRKIAALDRWSLAVRAVALLERAGRIAPIFRFDEGALLEEIRRTKEGVIADPNASVHAVVKRLNKLLLERPAKRAGTTSVEWGRLILVIGSQLAAEGGDASLCKGLLGALYDAMAGEEGDREGDD